MRVEIDQSGKIEKTSQTTIVAFANAKIKSLKISAKEKQRLVKIMRIRDHPRKIFIYKIFAGLIFLLLVDEKADSVIIDREYPGHEGIIKDVLRQLFKKARQPLPDIIFLSVGKKSPAHIAALAVFRGKQKPGNIIKAEDLLNIFYTKKGWSAPSRGENP